MTHVLFDLDGTLIDSLPGIVRALNHALEDVGRAPLEPARLRGYVGRPLRAIFRDLLGGPAEAGPSRLERSGPAELERVVAAYRRRFEVDGVDGCDAFPGVRDVLDELRAQGATMRIATVKPTGIAQRVLERLELDRHFASVHGADPDEHTTDKVTIVGDALAAAGVRGGYAVMIGDRAEDIRAARAHGVAALGVRWGYGGVDELVTAGADAIVDAPADVIDWLARSAARPPVSK